MTTPPTRPLRDEPPTQLRPCDCGHQHFTYPGLMGSCREGCGCVRYRPVVDPPPTPPALTAAAPQGIAGDVTTGTTCPDCHRTECWKARHLAAMQARDSADCAPAPLDGELADYDYEVSVAKANGYYNHIAPWIARLSTTTASLTAERAARAEPRRFTQEPDGCWAACIAGLTDIPHDELAALVPRHEGTFDGSMGTEYRNAVNSLLRSRGWRLESIGPDVPRGFAVGSGTSPRGLFHAVIVKDGALWHDPHPSRVGVVSLESFEVVIPIRPAADAAEHFARWRAALRPDGEGTT